MHQHLSVRIGGQHLHVFRIADIHFAQFLRIMCAARIEFANQLVVVLHPRGASGERLAEFMPAITGNEYLCLPPEPVPSTCRGVDQRDVRADADKGDWRALMNLDAQAIRHKAHHAGRFHPGNLLQLLLALGQRDEKMLRPMSPPITSMIWAWATCSAPATSIWSLESTRKRHECFP